MDVGNISYPAKLLLFGEYAVLQDCDALGIPYNRYSGRLSTSDSFIGNIQDYLSYLYTDQVRFSFLDTTVLESLIDHRVGYDSNIPMGYGLGSSAALTAAIYDICQPKSEDQNDLAILQQRLAEMESFFHGKSSGFDPLISLLQTPIHKTGSGNIYPILLPLTTQDVHIYLYDSGTKRNTHGFVPSFLKNAQDNPIYDTFYQANNLAIEDLLSSKNFLLNHIRKISTFQAAHMSMMIPDHVKEIWQKGLVDNTYYMKLCGAGGGGFFLVFSTSDNIDIDGLVKV